MVEILVATWSKIGRGGQKINHAGRKISRGGRKCSRGMANNKSWRSKVQSRHDQKIKRRSHKISLGAQKFNHVGRNFSRGMVAK